MLLIVFPQVQKNGIPFLFFLECDEFIVQRIVPLQKELHVIDIELQNIPGLKIDHILTGHIGVLLLVVKRVVVIKRIVDPDPHRYRSHKMAEAADNGHAVEIGAVIYIDDPVGAISPGVIGSPLLLLAGGINICKCAFVEYVF
jgi:hypothetical protein